MRSTRFVVALVVSVCGVVGVVWAAACYVDAEAERRAQVIISERQQREDTLPVCKEPPTLEAVIAEARRRLEAFGNTDITPSLLRLEVTRMRMERPIFPTPCRSPNTPVR